MELVKVVSSQLVALGYNPETQILVAQFSHSGGGVYYKYTNVPADSYKEVMDAESKGSAFNTWIKAQHYQFAKISLAELEALP